MGCASPRQPSLDFVKGSLDFTNPALRSKLLLQQQEKSRLCIPICRKQTSFAGTRLIRRHSFRHVLFMKRSRTHQERRGQANQIERKVRILKKLIPNSCELRSSVCLDNLFRETADYILALQLRVRVMQIMVDALSGSNN